MVKPPPSPSSSGPVAAQYVEALGEQLVEAQEAPGVPGAIMIMVMIIMLMIMIMMVIVVDIIMIIMKQVFTFIIIYAPDIHPCLSKRLHRPKVRPRKFLIIFNNQLILF